MSRNQGQDKKKLLVKLSKTPIVEVACKQADVPRSTYYRWVKQDKKFAEACDEAIARSSDLINDLAESQLIAAIKEKNITAIMYWLRHRHPAYVAKIKVDANIRNDQQELTSEQARVVAQALRMAGLTAPHDEDSDEHN